MYRYDQLDRNFVTARAQQFRHQVERRLAGALSEDEFKPLRLQNGLYLQLHAYMLRVAIPYGVLSAQQLRGLAGIARDFDRGFGHFTTRQNIQFNWIKLVETPDILDRLASFDMHAIQTSGNCIRNVTSDPFVGAAADELEDPRGWCEIIRQWSTLHPEFAFLPRKFKIAVSAGATDRAATGLHDIGLRMVKNTDGQIGFRVLVGGGQGVPRGLPSRSPASCQSIIYYPISKQFCAYIIRLDDAIISIRRVSKFWSRRWVLMPFVMPLRPSGIKSAIVPSTYLMPSVIGFLPILHPSICHLSPHVTIWMLSRAASKLTVLLTSG